MHNHYVQSTHFQFGQGAVIAGAGASVAVDSAVAIGDHAMAARLGGKHGRAPVVHPISTPVDFTPAALKEALDRIGVAATMECASQRPGSASRLFFELLAGLHRRQAEYQNIRMSREQDGSVEVWSADSQWVTAPLARGLGLAYDQIAGGLGIGVAGVGVSGQRAAAGAHRTYADDPAAVVAATPPAKVEEHLRSLGGRKEGRLPHSWDSRNPQNYGDPGYGLIDAAALGNECMQLTAKHIGRGTPPREGCLAIVGAAARAVFRDPRNAWVFAAPEGGYIAWTAHGWSAPEPGEVAFEINDQCVVALDLALRRVIVRSTADDDTFILAGGDDSGALVQVGARGGVFEQVRAGKGEVPGLSGPDPDLARVHPRLQSAFRFAPPVQLAEEVEAAIRREVIAADGDIGGAAEFVRRRACALGASAMTLLAPEDWESVCAQVCEATGRIAKGSAAPCHEELRRNWHKGIAVHTP